MNFVDKQTLNNAITKTTKKINDNCQDINLPINGKNYNYKDQLLNVFNNKETLLKTNNQYEQFLNQNSNYQKNNLGITFPMNYDGVYFPWWGFGDYFYWYMSSSTLKQIQYYLGWSEAAAATGISSLLQQLGLLTPFVGILTTMLLLSTADFILIIFHHMIMVMEYMLAFQFYRHH